MTHQQWKDLVCRQYDELCQRTPEDHAAADALIRMRHEAFCQVLIATGRPDLIKQVDLLPHERTYTKPETQ